MAEVTTEELLENVRLRLAEDDEAQAAFGALKERVEANEAILKNGLIRMAGALTDVYTMRSYTVWTLMAVPAIFGFTAGAIIALRWKR